MYKKIFVAIFLLLLLIPSVSMLVYRTDLSAEKREMAELPEFWTEKGLNLQYFQGLTDYVAEHFAFRQELITVDAAVKSKLFATSNNSQVIVGKEGWLFFEETLDDYRGCATLTNRGNYNCATVLRLLQEHVQELGGNFAFTIAPNKNSVYGEYMPARYQRETDAGNRKRLVEELERQNICYVDLYTAIRQAKESAGGDNLYHKLDTHWNNRGAVVAADALLTALGKEHTDYSQIAADKKKCFSGDLYGMLFPKGKMFDENVLFEKDHIFQEEQVDMGIVTVSEGKESSLLMFRDSFGNALYPYLADEYANAVFTKSLPYDTTLIEEYGSKDIVIEIAERHIPELVDGIPYSMALPHPFDDDVKETTGSTATMQVEEMDGCHLVYGVADRMLMDEDSEILICYNADNFCAMFEAFPAVYEMNEAEGMDDRDYCYGAYIEDAYFPTGEYELELITRKGDAYYTTGILRTVEIQND